VRFLLSYFEQPVQFFGHIGKEVSNSKTTDSFQNISLYWMRQAYPGPNNGKDTLRFVNMVKYLEFLKPFFFSARTFLGFW